MEPWNEVTRTVLLLALVFGYLLPAVIAERRKHPKLTEIFFVNLIFGWTVLGWIAALVWAATSFERQLRLGYKACNHCAEVIKEQAAVCRYCGRDVPHEVATPRVVGGA